MLSILSSFVSGLVPAKTPANNEVGTAIMNATAARRAEFGSLLLTTLFIEIPPRAAIPKSPCTAFLIHTAYLSAGCRSSPILWRRFLKLLSVACWPKRREAASPGRNSVAVNIATETKKRVTAIKVSLMTRNLRILQNSLG